MPQTPAYKRILLKLSGEALMGQDTYGINRDTVDRIVGEIAEVVNLGVEVAVVIGGGNIFRGVSPATSHMDRATELEADVHDGLENTLVILAHRLGNVDVQRQYDRSLPAIRMLLW